MVAPHRHAESQQGFHLPLSFRFRVLLKVYGDKRDSKKPDRASVDATTNCEGLKASEILLRCGSLHTVAGGAGGAAGLWVLC